MSEIERIRLEGRIGAPRSHFTDAVRAGPLLWISGMLGTNAEGELVSTDVVGQMERALQNIEIVLESTGLTFAQVVKVVIYLRDIEDRLKINPLRQRFFGESRPASTLVEVSALAIPGARVEIDAIAYAG